MITKVKPLELKVPADVMNDIGKAEIELIQNDAKAGGLSQNEAGNSNSPYSLQYATYKANQMNRFTTRVYKKGTKNLPPGYVAKAGTKLYSVTGSRTGLAGFNTNVGFKNYTLTGTMWNRMRAIGSKVNEVTVEYSPGDKWKVLGARDQGDELASLNDKNAELVKDMVIQELNKQLVDWAREDIIIHITDL